MDKSTTGIPSADMMYTLTHEATAYLSKISSYETSQTMLLTHLSRIEL
jgi:hypothetical protein